MPNRAEASEWSFSPGFLGSVGTGERTQGIGTEVSFMVFPESLVLGYGGLVQWQTYHRYSRWAAAFQAGSLIGGELGFARVTESAHHAGTWGVHVGAFASIALVGTALRLTTPLGDDGGQGLKGHPLELSWVLTVKLPISNAWGYTAGRPLRVEEDVRAAPPRRHSGWTLERAGPLVAHLSDAERASLAREWLRDGLLEHASVASFAALTLQLLGLGAPLELTIGCQQAGLQETEHARLCCAVASCYAGEELGPGPLNIEGTAPATTLEALAVQSFVDGCVNETLGAMVATRALTFVGDPTLKTALSTVARDEREHAELAWRIVRWCLDTAPREVGVALDELVAEAADDLDEAPEPCLLPTTLREHGRVPAREQRVLFRRARRTAVVRLGSILTAEGPFGRRSARDGSWLLEREVDAR